MRVQDGDFDNAAGKQVFLARHRPEHAGRQLQVWPRFDTVSALLTGRQASWPLQDKTIANSLNLSAKFTSEVLPAISTGVLTIINLVHSSDRSDADFRGCMQLAAGRNDSRPNSFT